MSYETKQGKLVYEFLKKHKEKHFSAEDVYYSLTKKGGKIGRTTVYRQLSGLVDEGYAKKFFTGDNDACCYQFVDKNTCYNHYHLKCTRCGKLFHLDCEFLDELSKHIYNDHKFTLDRTKTVLYGICENCQKEIQNQ